MSYILDALRRADSERDRGAVPNLFAQPLPRVSVDADTGFGLQRWLWVALVAAVLALVGMVAWRLTAPAAPEATAAQAPAASPVATPAPVVPPPAAVAPPIEPVPSTSTAATTPPTRAPVPARTARKPARSESPVGAAASVPESRIYARNELPADVQRDLPTLAIGGASYSESPANRMLIINGQVFHEGDKLAPDLVLEQIKLKTAVLRYKTYRYGVSY